MKKIFTIIIAFLALALPILAQGADGKPTSTPIELSTHPDICKPNPTVHRSPMRIPVEAWYDAAAETISILYYGDETGEANLYLNGQLIESSSEINTTFSASKSGFYTIEITTDSWTATGTIEI